MKFRTASSVIVLAMMVSSQMAMGQTGGRGTSGLGGTGSSGLSGNGSTNLGSGTSATGSTSTGTTGAAGQGGATVGSDTLGSNATQTFIGGNQTQGFVGGAREASTQLQNMNRQFQSIQNNQNQSAQQTTGTPRQIRTSLSVGFAFPSAIVPEGAGRLASSNRISLDRYALAYPEFDTVTVTVNGQGVAVLTGTTDSTESRRLAANLIRFQPGVRKVDNQLTVAN